MGCCFPGDGSVDGARKRCKEAIYSSVLAQLNGQNAKPALIDAIPTIGKTNSVAQFGAELSEGKVDGKLTYLTHRTANREQFEEMVREEVEADEDVDIVHLPVLENDCPTAGGEHGESWQNRITSLRNQGISPSSLHRNPRLGLPCGGPDCQYMDWYRNEGTSSIVIGHLSHAYVPEVVEDRIVIIDESPQDAFQTRFSASELHQLIHDFLADKDDLPAAELDSLKLLRQAGDDFEAARNTILEHAQDIDRVDIGKQILETGQGHVNAAVAVRGLLQPAVEKSEGKDSYRIELENGVEYARLDDSTDVAYDPESGEMAIRQVPEFSEATALVGLDGTPTAELWRGRLGVDELKHIQVLCDECRQEYLQDILGYRLVQTTPYIKPYSGATANRISFEKDRGLLNEVDRRSRGAIGLITTKRVRNEILEYDDENEVSIPESLINHYRNLKGSNEFAGDEVKVGVILGSPHPGPDELRLLAGLNGDSFDTEIVEATRDGHHYSRREPTTDESQIYLRHVREHSVAQAILRFGREEGATVFVNTAALPDWIQSICDEAFLRRRPDGERAVIEALSGIENGTTAEIADQTEFSADTARIHLEKLVEEGIVERSGTDHRIIWEASDEVSEVSPTAYIKFPVSDF